MDARLGCATQTRLALSIQRTILRLISRAAASPIRTILSKLGGSSTTVAGAMGGSAPGAVDHQGPQHGDRPPRRRRRAIWWTLRQRSMLASPRCWSQPTTRGGYAHTWHFSDAPDS